ncbi:uncharacterized protein LOC100366923 [Saccoglossus kowalevskii]|uniref:WAS/WASL-interacting protein family member 2-like n=1 Tax=Saccoglossus kowalevskii TaxID=10224 RepID=A0ABM0GTM0_SACKO|nr:PREDICTED: WAS/WASL-interacting protein family member 2-like [Saccoglossus kowalevskii]
MAENNTTTPYPSDQMQTNTQVTPYPVDPNQPTTTNATGAQDQTGQQAPPPAGFQPGVEHEGKPGEYPTEPPPPYQPPGGWEQPVGPAPGQPGYGLNTAMYYGATGQQVNVVSQPRVTGTTTYIIKDEPPPSRVNHCLHCIISIIFWPWVFVWCALCIMESKENERWARAHRNY